MFPMLRFFRFAPVLLLAPALAWSQGVSAWLPLDLPPQVARQIDKYTDALTEVRLPSMPDVDS